MTKVCVLGEGAFGTALAMVLAGNGHDVQLWCYYEHVAQSIALHRRNPLFLPDQQLHERISAHHAIADAVRDAEYIVEAIPVKYLRSVVQSVQPHVTAKPTWIIASKGIENDTLLFPTDIVSDGMGFDVPHAVIMGPSFATQLARGDMTGLMVASHNDDVRSRVHALFSNDYVSLYPTHDVHGVQVAAALKNVIALAVGMLESVTESQNTKALLITKALDEIATCIEHYGGIRETAYSLAGVGDLIGSTFGTQSRNLDVGRRFGRGQSLDDIIAQTGYIPEGVNTTRSVHQLIERNRLSLPLCSAVYSILFEAAPIEVLLKAIG